MAARATYDSSLLLDDAGNAVEGNWLSRKIAGERLIEGRKKSLYDAQTKRNYSASPGAVKVVNPNTHMNPELSDMGGFKGILAMQENGAAAQGKTMRVDPRGLGALDRQARERYVNPLGSPLDVPKNAWSLGGPTDGSAWSQGGATDGSAWSLGGSKEWAESTRKGSAMPPARAQVPMDDVDAAAQTGSGAAVAMARKRQELGLAALESALMRQRLADQDPDGSQAATVELGRARHDEEWDQNVGDPRRQASKNALGALAGAAKRDEWTKDWQTQAPQRNYHDQQFQTRYVEPARIRGEASLGVAETNADSRQGVAETNAAGRLDAAQMRALENAVREMFRQGQPAEARAYGETGGALPPSTISQRLQRLQQERPGLKPENYINLLGEIDDEEEAEALRILGVAAPPYA